jgi:nitrogen fixation protein FixH
MSRTVLPTRRRQQGLGGRHVLMVVLGFFGVVFLVNGVMIYSALSTHTGLVANEPYRKGLHYNERIEADERQARLGWSDTIEIGRDGRVALLVAHRDGRPVTGLQIEAVLGRPSTNRHDIKLKLAESAPGRYGTRTAPLGEGSWLIAAEARIDARAEDPIYRTRRRLWLKP